MWYFAYALDMSRSALNEWTSATGEEFSWRRSGRRAVLPNHQLWFPVYDEFWSGGVADIMPERGKQVFGALFRASPAARERLDRLAHRSIDRWGRESGLRWLVPVQVIPYGGVEPVEAWTYRLIRHEWQHVPPTRRYLDKLVAAACEVGHSMAWAMHLRSFAVRETPRRPHLLHAEAAFTACSKPVRWRTTAQPADVQHHVTAGLTWRVNQNLELSGFYAHAFEENVKGANNFNNGNANIHMSQDSFGVALGWKF